MRRTPCTPAACGRGVSGSLSLPSRGPFHLSLTVLCSIGHWVVFSLAGWSPRLPARFHVSRSTLDPAAAFPRFAYGALTLFGRSFQDRSAALEGRSRGPNPGARRAPVWAPPVSLAATPGITFVFSSSGYLDVSVRRVPLRGLWIPPRICGSSPHGFPHSETCGSSRMCRSPQLFAACRVFRRLPVPRHPPRALSSLTPAAAPLAWGPAAFLSFLLWFSLSFPFRSGGPPAFPDLGCLCLGIRFSRYGSAGSPAVETKRFELSTPCLQGRCSPS